MAQPVYDLDQEFDHFEIYFQMVGGRLGTSLAFFRVYDSVCLMLWRPRQAFGCIWPRPTIRKHVHSYAV